MAVNIEICIKGDQTTTEKGRILEDLTAKILKIQQYDVLNTVRVTGMEIDVLAKHKVNNSQIFVECKAWENPLPADVITKLLGNIFLRKASAGWLITTGPLSKDANGIRAEWETDTNPDREKLSFYTQDRILTLLADAHEIVSLESVRALLENKFTTSSDATLMLTTDEIIWLIPVLDDNSNFVSAVVAFDARTGKRVCSEQRLNSLKSYKNSYSGLQWLASESIDTKSVELLNEEFNSIVPVISGDDWTDYRPARPEDFVGRKAIIADIFEFLEGVNAGNSSTRLFSIKAPSGMGKSSVVLKLTALSKNRKYSKRFFMYAVDVRTAMSARYAEMVIRSCIDKADATGFTDVTNRKVGSSNITQYLQDVSIQRTLSYLKEYKKTIVIVFDQFEELFSKKELYPLFDNVRILCNLIDSLQGAVVLGFAWKTDLTIPAEHPAYYMWSNLADRRKEFELAQFKAPEIKSAINLFGKQLGEKVNPILSNYLTKQCQGYPWLLKKLCIHVFKLIVEGNSQDSVIGQKLNIVDLFERDISDLTPDQHACLKEIAKDSPADYFGIIEVYGNNMVQVLVNDRLVIRRASKLTLYWDIFRDYVLNKTIPELLLDYIPQQQFSSVIKLLQVLLEGGNMSVVELSEKLSMSIATIDNIMIDAVMFGVVQKEDNQVYLLYKTVEEFLGAIQDFFRKHIILKRISSLSNEGFDYLEFSRIFNEIYTGIDVNGKTKITYCSKLYNWFVRLGFFIESQGRVAVSLSVTPKAVLLSPGRTSRRGRYQTSNNNLFWGQTSPEKMLKAYETIQNGENSYNSLKKQGYRNAIEVLTAAHGLQKVGDRVTLQLTLPEIFENIAHSETISYVREIIKCNPQIKNVEMGQLLNDKFSRSWTASSKMRYGSALIVWIKYLDTRNL